MLPQVPTEEIADPIGNTVTEFPTTLAHKTQIRRPVDKFVRCTQYV